MLENFEISIKDIRRDFYEPTNISEEDLLSRIKSLSNLDNSGFKLSHPNAQVFHVKDQTYIPHYAMNFATNKVIINNFGKIEDIHFHKFYPVTGGRNIGNNIVNVFEILFNYWSYTNIESLAKLQFTKNGVIDTISLGPGIMFNSEGKILFCLVYKKELLDKMNSISGYNKFLDFYSLYLERTRSGSGISFETFLNENAIMMFSRDFTTNPKYQRFYKPLVSTLINGIRYELDSIITDSIEKHIWSLPNDYNTDIQQFETLQKKNEFCKSVSREALLT